MTLCGLILEPRRFILDVKLCSHFRGGIDILSPQAKINKKWFLLLIFIIPLVGLHTVDVKIECPSVLFEWKPVTYSGLLGFLV